MNQGIWYCGNIVVATFLCLNFSLLSAAGAPIDATGLQSEIHRTSFQGMYSVHVPTM